MSLPILMKKNVTNGAIDGTLSEVRRINPLKLTATFSLRDIHTAQMTLPEGEEYASGAPRIDAIKLHDPVLIRTPNGTPYVFRVTNIAHALRGTIEISMNHFIDTLNDDIWAAKYSARGVLVNTFVSNMLGYQTVPFWSLGTYELGSTARWYQDDIDYAKLSEEFSMLRDAYTSHQFTFTHIISGSTVTENRLNILGLPQEVTAEFRLSRNVEQCRYTRDDSGLCNHLYLKWHSKGGEYYYVKQFTYPESIARYGEISDSIDLSTTDTESNDYQKYALTWLSRYAKPKLTVNIDGFQLSRLTGREWDEMAVGKLVRMALPEYGETYTERCNSVTYPDMLGQPDRITVELGDHQERLTEITANTRKQRSGGSGQYIIQGGGDSGHVFDEDGHPIFNTGGSE